MSLCADISVLLAPFVPRQPTSHLGIKLTFLCFYIVHTFHLFGKAFSHAIGEAVMEIFLARLSVKIQLFVLGQRDLLVMVVHMRWKLPRV